MRRALALWLTTIAFATTLGCRPPFFGGKGPSSTVAFRIITEDETNQGRALHGVVRAVTAQEFLVDDYESITDRAYATPPHDDVLATFAIIPGERQTLSVKRPQAQDVGVYFLFSEPGAPWKLHFPQPLRRRYQLQLDRDSVSIR